MYLAAEKKKQAAAALTKYIEKFGAPGQGGGGGKFGYGTKSEINKK